MQQQEGFAGDQSENKLSGMKGARIVEIGVVVVVVTAIVALGYRVEPFVSATGFGETVYTKETTQFNGEGSVVKTDRAEDPRRAKTLWDWLQLLGILAIPVAVAIATYKLNQRARERELNTEKQRRQNELKIEVLRERDNALQEYLKDMSELLIDKELHTDPRPHSAIRVTARARTFTVLSQLDSERKKRVVQFLRETRLINKQLEELEGRLIYPRLVGLADADLRCANLKDINLANMSLERVDLTGADLRDADLRGAELPRVIMHDAKLQNAKLSGADLRGADLSGANLQGVDLEGTNLKTHVEPKNRTQPRPTNLREAKNLTQEQISGAFGDRRTLLPDHLQPPQAWSSNIDEQPKSSAKNGTEKVVRDTGLRGVASTASRFVAAILGRRPLGRRRRGK